MSYRANFTLFLLAANTLVFFGAYRLRGFSLGVLAAFIGLAMYVTSSAVVFLNHGDADPRLLCYPLLIASDYQRDADKRSAGAGVMV
jgi:hypothetical protein